MSPRDLDDRHARMVRKRAGWLVILFLGEVLPFVLKRLGFDPAASSAPLVATLIDVTGL